MHSNKSHYSNLFYEKHQNNFRGSRNEILLRLSIYKQFTDYFLRNKKTKIIDLGCGRGEWLELTKLWGFMSYGYDIDEGSLNSCNNYGLLAYNKDIFEALKDYKNDSVDIITCFHVLEHLEFDKIKIFFAECYRILKNDGLLIVETPNPENILVMTETFWLDPTHIKPIPAGLLTFLAKYFGFDFFSILRLNSTNKLSIENESSVFNLLKSIAPDICLIALKSNDIQLQKRYLELSSNYLGNSLEDIILNFDKKILNEKYLLNKSINDNNNKIEFLYNELQKIKNEINNINDLRKDNNNRVTNNIYEDILNYHDKCFFSDEFFSKSAYTYFDKLKKGFA
jgi:O-antigen chain-terminating methyltransferase